MGELSKIVNIGRVLEADLREIGINTIEELRSTGSKEAFLRIRENDYSACLHKLYGLEGAV